MGFLDHRLEKIRKDSDFFSWFHLEETGPAREVGERKVLTFKPSGEIFRDLVNIDVSMDGEGRIRELVLDLKRSFIDDAANGIFARDIAKSLLRAAVPRENQEDILGLGNEIEFLSSSSKPVVTARTDLPKLPDQPSLGYQVFVGQETRFEQVLSRCVVRLENATDALKLSLTSRGLQG